MHMVEKDKNIQKDLCTVKGIPSTPVSFQITFLIHFQSIFPKEKIEKKMFLSWKSFCPSAELFSESVDLYFCF